MPSLIRQNPAVTFQDVEENVIVESRLHARKASMAMDYTGPIVNIEPALNLYYQVAVDGRDDIVVTTTSSGDPIDLSFDMQKVQNVIDNCARFPSSVKPSFC